MPRSRTEAIRQFILLNVQDNPESVSALAQDKFAISRSAVSRHLKTLVEDGFLEATGQTRARRYSLKSLKDVEVVLPLKGLEEDIAWRDHVAEIVAELPNNIVSICNYGFTEMLNNAIDHSGGTWVVISASLTAVTTKIVVDDNGVGIFNHIQKELGLDDPRHALLELSKGKLTTDATRHTGEGIFFTSRMFDEFAILSDPLYYLREKTVDDDWLVETGDNSSSGTYVRMEIGRDATHTLADVFDQYSGEETYAFTRTHVPLLLANYEPDQLISRSAARRVLARFDRFEEVVLDFTGVDSIGQSFADEVFRVFKNEHPSITVVPIGANAQVARMIARAEANAQRSD